ncbi:MAG: hypothetical protein KF896_10670 [Ignavibacteriae bacterium]|nr:hypothetical protein [Ignavibacteriota bacterium]
MITAISNIMPAEILYAELMFKLYNIISYFCCVHPKKVKLTIDLLLAG